MLRDDQTTKRPSDLAADLRGGLPCRVAGRYNDGMPWRQHHVTLPAFPRGFHLISRHVLEAVPEIKEIRVGLLHVFIQHTSASITINENADPDVRVDLESAFNAIAPEDFPYVHTMEGPDDMPAHVKAAMLGSSVTVPIENGRLALGTWQGIYLCEHRNAGGRRRLVVTVMGEGDGDGAT